MTPRSLFSRNAMSCWTCGLVAQSACFVSSMASVRFFFLLKKSLLYALRRNAISSEVNPRRWSPIWLMALTDAGLPSAMVNGGMSWTTLVNPPTME